jgi:hypothetical protein
MLYVVITFIFDKVKRKNYYESILITFNFDSNYCPPRCTEKNIIL